MEKTVQELKVLIRELILELGDLKERVYRLEQEKIEKPVEPPRQNSEIIKLQGESYDQLGKIYNEGYHVCPVAYGTPRQDGCIFCIAFMNKG
ncbi:MAG: initiation control protein YabA [Syntrophomonadaceae bacterium]|nr:initiation control protein YabA [Syntrophomonadaceae bacterium]